MLKDTIIVHCSATDPKQKVTAAEIDRWHKDRGWRSIGYAYVIRRDGTIEAGRDLDGDGIVLDETGAHAAGLNSRSIGICLIGGKGSSPRDEFADHYTKQQDEALRELIAAIQVVAVTPLKVIGHNDVTDAKACPGFQVGEWLGGDG